MSYPGERAIIDGSDRQWSKSSKSLSSSPTLFKIKANYYTVIKDITFRNSAGRGLYLQRATTIIVRNVLSHNHHSDGIYLLGNYDSLFEDSVSHSNYSRPEWR